MAEKIVCPQMKYRVRASRREGARAYHAKREEDDNDGDGDLNLGVFFVLKY